MLSLPRGWREGFTERRGHVTGICVLQQINFGMPTSIRDEIRQTRPFRSLHAQVYINLARTHRRIEEDWIRYLKRVEGLSVSQYNILRILRGAHPVALRVGDLGDRMLYRDSDVTRLLDRMVKRGLVGRERDTEDRRQVLIGITEEGLAVVGRLDPLADQTVLAAMAGLDEAELRTLDRLLDTLRAGVVQFDP